MFQKRLPNKIAIGCFARSDKINYWNVKATGGIFYRVFFGQNRLIHLQRCKPHQPAQSTSPRD